MERPATMSRPSHLPAILAALLLPVLLCGCNRGSEIHLSGPTAPLMAPLPTGEECHPRTQAYWRRQCDTHREVAPAHPDWSPKEIGELLAIPHITIEPVADFGVGFGPELGQPVVGPFVHY